MRKALIGFITLSIITMLEAQNNIQNNINKEKTEIQESTEKKEIKLHTMTGIITSINKEKKTITVTSIRKKGEIINFSYDGVKFKDKNNEIEGDLLKVGDKVKIKYEMKNQSPLIKKAMIIRGEVDSKILPKKEMKSSEEEKTK